MTDIVYLLGLACLFNHELDAICRGEWRLFFGWLPISDERGFQLFIPGSGHHYTKNGQVWLTAEASTVPTKPYRQAENLP
jgi:hypothetical protein